MGEHATNLARIVAFGAAAWLGWWTVTEAGPDAPRVLDPVPTHAADEGYGHFRWWERGRAFRWSAKPKFDPDGPIIVDTRHVSRQGVDVRLTPADNDYWSMHGYARAFDPARAAGVAIEPIGWSWNLDGASAVFINLVSGDNPGFRWSEVRALRDFIRDGGGLLLITDHTDCYLHGDMLAQLTAELGLSLPPVTVADPENGLGPRAKAWFRSVHLAPHPVTDGVRAVGFMTAGEIVGLTPIVRSGPNAWADRWDPYRDEENAGFTGALEREADEPLASVPVVAAGEVGRGRVVVLADQNAFGGSMIGYADNARLFSNAIGWVSHRSFSPPAPAVRTLGRGCADAGLFGYRTLQVRIAAIAVDACEAGEGPAAAYVVLPGASAPPGVRAVVIEDHSLEAVGASTSPPLHWEGFRAVDATDRVLVEQIGSTLVVHEGDLLKNANLGGERDPVAFPPAGEVLDHVLAFVRGRE